MEGSAYSWQLEQPCSTLAASSLLVLLLRHPQECAQPPTGPMSIFWKMSCHSLQPSLRLL